MRCKECGESARDVSLRYCENCGAKMPVAPDRRTSARPALKDGGVSSRTVTRDASEPPRPVSSPRPEPSAPPYDGPAVLARVPGHSPSVLAVGLQWLAVLLAIIPLFSSVGALGSLLVILGGWLVVARELRDAGVKHPLFDWVPDPLMHPAVPAVYTVVSVALAVRMLGLGLTPLLWLVAAVVLTQDQYRKVYDGGWSRVFELRQLLRGTSLVTLGGVAVCLVALFFNWVPARIVSHTGGPTPRGPSQLHVVETQSSSSDFIYSLMNAPEDAGWDRPGSVALELVLFGVLVLLALRPEVHTPAWLRFAPLGAVVLALLWMLVFGGLMAGPLLFLIGLSLVGVATVFQAFAPHRAEERPDEGFSDDPEEATTEAPPAEGDHPEEAG